MTASGRKSIVVTVLLAGLRQRHGAWRSPAQRRMSALDASICRSATALRTGYRHARQPEVQDRPCARSPKPTRTGWSNSCTVKTAPCIATVTGTRCEDGDLRRRKSSSTTDMLKIGRGAAPRRSW